MYKVGVIIVSDRAFSGEREDASLPVFEELLQDSSYSIVKTEIVPDESIVVGAALERFIEAGMELIFTSGGTGCAVRDITPEATLPLLDKPTPGLDEAIRRFSTDKSPFAVYSRAVSGVAGRSFIVNLPGSPTAVREILEFLLPTIEHPLGLLAGKITDCAAENKE